MGTPGFAVPALTALAERPDLCEVVGVVTQPDRPSGRGRKLTASPVKIAAQARNIPVLQPTKMKIPQTASDFSDLRADIAVVAAYGRILPPALLQTPRLGCINIHASLLPRHRGASPIAHAIMAGDKTTGVGIMQMDEGLDTGPVFSTREVSIEAEATCGSLTVELAQLGAELLIETLPSIVDGSLVAAPQSNEGMTYAALLKKSDGALNLASPAQELERRIRGLNPWPGCFVFKGEQRVQVLRAVLADVDAAAGLVTQADAEGICVACGQGGLRLLEVKPAGKKAMQASAWVAGRGIKAGDRFDLAS